MVGAGGIYYGENMYDIMQLGAKGVQVASRFVTTKECDADVKFKNTYVKAVENDVEIIQSPVGMPGRALEGKFLENVKLGLTRPKSCPYNCLHTCDYKVVPYCIILALYNAYKGKMDKGYAFARSNAYLSARISTVKEVIHSMISEFNKKEADVMAGSKV